jgi:hypothetical protein
LRRSLQQHDRMVASERRLRFKGGVNQLLGSNDST